MTTTAASSTLTDAETDVDSAVDALAVARLWSGLDGDPDLLARVLLEGPDGGLPSSFAVSALATGTVAVANLALAELVGASRTGVGVPLVRIDRRHAAVAFACERHLQPIGWSLPPVWDPLAGDYATADGWIRLHTNYAHHRTAAVRALGLDGRAAPSADDVASVVRNRAGDELERAVVEAGGCAAMLRSDAEWAAHPQGRALAAEPIVACQVTSNGHAPSDGPPSSGRDAPLAGVRVLDLTRVIAGPVATRFLAAHGADVLRIDPGGFEEVPALLAETTAGKHCAALDLRASADRSTFEALVAGADVLVHGYRPGALAGLGYGTERLQELNPGLVVGRLNAYGWTGPWTGRRGFDSLVQMSTGIAERGMRDRGSDRPVPLPVQALDHGTGYLLAAAVLRGLARRRAEGVATEWRCSLARTARLLRDLGSSADAHEPGLVTDEIDRYLEPDTTFWGPVRRVGIPGRIDSLDQPRVTGARPLGASPACWR